MTSCCALGGAFWVKNNYLKKKITPTTVQICRLLLARVPSLVRFFDNLTDITCVKEQVAEFFFTEAVNSVVSCGAVGLMCTVTILLKIKVCDMATRNWQFLINKHKETALPKSLFCDLEADIRADKLLYE